MRLELKKIDLTVNEYRNADSVGSQFYDVYKRMDHALSEKDLDMKEFFDLTLYPSKCTVEQMAILYADALFIARARVRKQESGDLGLYEDIVLNKAEDRKIKQVVVSEFYRQAKEMDLNNRVAIRFVDKKTLREVTKLTLLG